MGTRKKFRMSAPVVVIGFIVLIPSILGICASVLILLGVTVAGGSASNRVRNQAVTSMRNNSVPEPIISAVLAGQDQEVDRLMDNDETPEVQRSWVRDAQEKIRGTNATAGIGILVGGGFAGALGIASFVGGLLGFLLVMRKRVLQCSFCGAVVNAS
jgi:hypothetical protein